MWKKPIPEGLCQVGKCSLRQPRVINALFYKMLSSNSALKLGRSIENSVKLGILMKSVNPNCRFCLWTSLRYLNNHGKCCLWFHSALCDFCCHRVVLHPVCLDYLQFFIPIFCQGFLWQEKVFTTNPDLHCHDKWL